MNVGPGYMELINMAQANSQSKAKELQRKQNLAREKKVNPKEVKLKVGVQKFLAKKEEEERRKREEANRKKQQLMELRNQDRKANSRVRRMINMTKSANKSVIADARECLSEACIEQASEAQPDEDDYGYTSNFANEMYNKMLQKYQSDAKKEPSHWSKLVGPKIHHIKTSLPQGKEPSSKSSSKHNVENIVSTSTEMLKIPKIPKKKQLPPPPGFDELLKIAEQKSKEPIAIQKPTKESLNGPEFEFGRPMTAREKKTFLQEQALKQRAQAAFSGNQPARAATVTSVSKTSESTASHPKSIPIPKHVIPKSTSIPQEPLTTKKITKDSFDIREPEAGRLLGAQSKKSLVQEQSSKPRVPANISGYQNSKSVISTPTSTRTSEVTMTNSKNKPTSSSKLNRPPTASTKVADTSTRVRPNEPYVIPARGGSQQSYRPSMPPPTSQKRDKPQRKGRAIIESDEDNDSEMDDFIDDSDVPGEDISSMIGQMFGYNKRKYINEDSDDECMESSVAQQMFEEARTLRLGVMEDLEDMKMEEEEKKRKAAFLKKRKLK